MTRQSSRGMVLARPSRVWMAVLRHRGRAGELPDTTATDVQSTSQATEPETLSRTIPAAPLTAGPRFSHPEQRNNKKRRRDTMASTNPRPPLA